MTTRPHPRLIRPLDRSLGLLSLIACCGLSAVSCGDSDRASASGAHPPTEREPVEPQPVGTPDQVANGAISVDEAGIVGTASAGQLSLRVPLRTVDNKAAAGELVVSLRSVDDASVLHSQTLPYEVAGGDEAELVAEFELPEGADVQAKLVPWNVRVSDGTDGGVRITRSLLHVLPAYEVRMDGPANVKAGRGSSYRIQTRDALSLQPLIDYPISLGVYLDDELRDELTGTSDATGVAQFEFNLDEAGHYEVRAASTAQATRALVKRPLEVVAPGAKVLLTTDKPIYQPGQTLHLRTLALEPPSNEPVQGAEVLLELEDGKGNKIMKRTVTSDDFGIASTRFVLGQILNLGTFKVRATTGERVTEKTVEVARYSLPKFRVEASPDKSWYTPGETLRGTIDAGYFFGQPVADAEVIVEGYTLDVGETLFARVQGRSNAEGQFEFSMTLPASVAALPLGQGNALADLRITVTDGAGQQVTKDQMVTLAPNPIQVSVVPEGSELIPGVDNVLFVFVNDPQGNPVADATVALSIDGEELDATTDEFGQAEVVWRPEAGATTVEATVEAGGDEVTESFRFNAQSGAEHVLVRTDRAVYATGDDVQVEVISTANSPFVYIDWLNDGQVVDMRTVEIDAGTAAFSTPLDATLLGSNRVEAYIVDDDGNIVRAGRTFFARNATALDIKMTADKETYAPGETAELTFSVADDSGNPAVAALGLQVVDEAIFSLIESRPGLLRTHFELEDAYAQPSYQIRPPMADLTQLLFGSDGGDDEARQEANQQLTSALFASLDGLGVTGVQARSWPEVVTEGHLLLADFIDSERERLVAELDEPIASLIASLEESGCDPEDTYCDATDTYFADELYALVSSSLAVIDFWGNPYVPTQGGGGELIRLTSSGPDEIAGNEDDETVVLGYADFGIELRTWGRGDGVVMNGADAEGPVFAGEPGAAPPMVDGAPTPSGGKDDSQAQPRVRRDFPETLYVNPALITGPDGTATIEVPLADSITEWRVTALGNSSSGRLGSMQGGMTVFQDFFVDIDFPATLTRGDEVGFPVAIYNYLDSEQTVELELEPGDWYTALGSTTASVTLAPSQVQGVRFPVRVDEVGTGTLTVRGYGASRSDAVARTVRVVPDGRAAPATLSGSLEPGELTLPASFPQEAVPGSEQLFLNVYPAYLSQVVEGMDSMLQEPNGCFEQTTSSTWPNVLVLDYMQATSQITPEIQMKAESLISTGYQRLLTFEHSGGGFSWFGEQDPEPFLSVTAFGLMEFVDMNEVANVDEAMIDRTRTWLMNQQQADGSWEGDVSEFFSFHTGALRNSAFVLWALAYAGAQGAAMDTGLGYLESTVQLQSDDAYTLGMVANALAIAAPSSALLGEVLGQLETTRSVEDDLVSWDSGGTQTSFYGSGQDGAVATTALVTHAMLLAGGYTESVSGALRFLAGAKDSQGNFGSTQATIWTLRTLLLAASTGTESAVGTLDVAVDGEPFTTVELSEAQGDVMTTVDLGGYATTGDHEVGLTFVGTGQVSYHLVASHHVPWQDVPEPTGPLAVNVSYDKTQLYVNELVEATVAVQNQTATTTNMVLVTVGVPPGFSIVTEDLQSYLASGQLSHFDRTGKQLNLYVTELAAQQTLTLSYRLQASMPVRAADGGAEVYPYYEPDQKSSASSTLLEVLAD